MNPTPSVVASDVACILSSVLDSLRSPSVPIPRKKSPRMSSASTIIGLCHLL